MKLLDGKTMLVALNAIFLLLGLFMPSLKDLLTPELQLNIVASVNGIALIVIKVMEKGEE